MVASAEWRTVRDACVEIDVPPDMAPSAAQGIEGPAMDLAGHGLRLIVDCSPFADPLTSYEAKPGLSSPCAVSGTAVRWVKADKVWSVIAAPFL